MSEITQPSKHDHSHGHEHSHDHKLPIILYVIGIVAYVAAFFIKKENNNTLANILYLVSTFSAGYHVIYEGIVETFTDTIEHKRFKPDVHLLMALATIGACLIGEYAEAAILMLIFAGAHFLEDYAEDKSQREISQLLSLNPSTARRIAADGRVEEIAADQVGVGDHLRVLNGDQIASDGVILSGTPTIDESAINGESIPVDKEIGDPVFAGTMNGGQAFDMEVTKDNSKTMLNSIINMVAAAQENQGETATWIQKLEPHYVRTVLILVPLFIILAPFFTDWTYSHSFYRGMVLLVAASPCALVASAAPATLSAMSNIARRGVLTKGGSYLTELSNLDAIAFDKTGTLTEGRPQVVDYGIEHDQPQHIINIIVGMEEQSNHPLAQAVTRYFQVDQSLSLTVENLVGQGLTTSYQGKTYHIAKPSSFDQGTERFSAILKEQMGQGRTLVYIAEDDRVIGWIAFMDLPQESALKALKYFQQEGIHTVMITGDSQATGEAIAKQLNIEEVEGNVLPEEKARIIQEKQDKYGSIAMVGDGINDAPALTTADIGVAMGQGTDTAIDVADIVLMQNDLNSLTYAHRLARRMNRIIWQNIIFSLFVIVTLIVLNLMEKADITLGVILHEGSTIVVLFNSLRLLIPLDKE